MKIADYASTGPLVSAKAPGWVPKLSGDPKEFFNGEGAFTAPTGGAGTGDVTGPASSVSGNLPAFADTTGKLLSDSGKSASSFDAAGAAAAAQSAAEAFAANASNITGGTLAAARLPNTTVTPGSYTATNLTVDATGRITAAANGGGSGGGNVTGPASATSGNVAVYDGGTGKIIKDGGTLGTAAFSATGDFDAAGAAAAAQAASDPSGSASTAQTNAENYADTYKLAKASNLSDVASAATSRTNLGLGTAATHAATDFDAAGAAATAQANAEAYAANSSNQSSGTLNAARLPNTAVTPGNYTNTNLTVDATGRITGATNGSAGSGLPSGGATFQRLAKNSATNYDVGWYGPYEFNVKDCGAKGDGSTDDTAAINNAITALNGAGSGQLVFPAGTYKITAALTTITVPCGIVGQGGGVSIISTTSGSANVFTITATGQCVIRDIGITGSSTGYGISFNASGGGNGSSIVDGVSVSGFARGLDASNSNNMVVSGCVLQSNTIGLYYNNSSSANPDAGGGFVSDTLFLSNTYGIYQLNNGGETISNCQFHNNQWHIYVTLTGATYGNSDTKITGCWLDQWKYAAIHFDQGDSSSPMSNVCITGNSFSALDTAGMAGQNVIEVIGTASNFGQNWAITGNQFQYAEQASGDAIHLVNCTQFNISGNQFFEVGVYSGHAIYIESNCSLIAWDPHQLFDNSNGAPVVDNQTFPSVSSASTITLPTWGTYCKVTGSTAVSTINGGWQGRQIALLCPSGVAFNTGGNIAGAVTVAAGRQVSLTFDGTSWYPD